MAMTRRGFLGGVAAAVFARPLVKAERFLPKPLPPPEPEVTDFVRVVVPMCFYSHVRKVTLTWNLNEAVNG